MRRISVPGSKSVSVRTIFLAALSSEPTVLRNVLECEDARFLRETLERFGVQFQSCPNREIKVIPPKELHGNDSDNFIGNAGTPTRFLVALSLLTQGSFSLRGVPRMHERPFQDLFDAVRSLGVKIQFEDKENCLPARFQSSISNLQSSKKKKSPSSPREIPTCRDHFTGQVSPFSKEGGQEGVVKISGSISSQFLSGLLLVAPKMKNGLTIELTDTLKSRPYVEMTLSLLQLWGVKVKVSNDFRVFRVEPGLHSPKTFSIPADCSSASYPIEWSLLSGNPICIENFGQITFQGDEKFLEIVQKFGAEVRRSRGAVEIHPPRKLLPLGKVNFSALPDVSMTAMAIAAFADGVSEFQGIESLRLKECDRIEAMREGLEKLGVKVKVTGDVMTIFGNDELRIHPMKSCEAGIPTLSGLFYGVNSFEDHRIAMVFGVLRSALKMNFEITHPECVVKSWPDFWLHVAEWEGALRPVSAVIVEKTPRSPLTKGGNTFLVVKKPRAHHAWQFPQGGTEEGENGVQTAQRELSEECGPDVQIQFESDQPVGEYRYFFPPDFKRHKPEIRGARTRFFRAKYVSGEIYINREELADFAWVSRKKLSEIFEKDYWAAVEKFV